MTVIKEAVVEWLATGETGVSSKTMAFWLGYGIKYRRASHPHDPGDFDRCLQLLAFVPELRSSLGKMAEVSPEWASVVKHWDEIEASHLAEVGLGWTKARYAPKTYAMMKRVISGQALASNHEAQAK